MKNVVVLAALLTLATAGQAQKNDGTYDWGIGLKYQPAAISVKKYTKQGDALELLLSKYSEGYRATVLFELCPSLNTPKKSVRLVLGPGFHTGFRLKKYLAISNESNPVVGIDFIGGVEWKLPKIPFTIQADYQPSIDLIGYNDYYSDWGGITLRYTW